MKYTIHGLYQPELIKYPDVDIIDAAILNYIIDYIASGKMSTFDFSGERYFWVHYDSLLNDLPILRIKKDTLYRRLKKLVEIGLLKSHTVKIRGTYSYYKLTDKIINLQYGSSSENKHTTPIDSQTDNNPMGTDQNPKGTDCNPGGSDQNPEGYGSKSVTGTDQNPEQRPTTKEPTTKLFNTNCEDENHKATAEAADLLKDIEKLLPPNSGIFPTESLPDEDDDNIGSPPEKLYKVPYKRLGITNRDVIGLMELVQECRGFTPLTSDKIIQWNMLLTKFLNQYKYDVVHRAVYMQAATIAQHGGLNFQELGEDVSQAFYYLKDELRHKGGRWSTSKRKMEGHPDAVFVDGTYELPKVTE